MLPALIVVLCSASPESIAKPFAKGDLVGAWRAASTGDDLQGRYLTCLLVPRCAWQDGLRPMLVDVDHGFARRAPLAIFPPQKPAVAGRRGYVNVATAMLRARPDAESAIEQRLTIGTPVDVKGFEGGFARVAGGYVHRDLLSSEKPTVAALLRASGVQGSLDGKVTMLWRAFNLDPARTDVLERLVVAALKAERAPVIGDALALALARGTWDANGVRDTANRTFRAVHGKRIDELAGLLPDGEDLRRHYQVAGDGALFGLADAVLRGTEAAEAREPPSTCDQEVLDGLRTAAEPCRALIALGAPRPEDLVDAPRVDPEKGAPPAGHPVVAFYDYDSNAGIVVNRWNGKAWQALGAPRAGGRSAGQPLLATQPNGALVLLYAADNGEVYLERWTGDGWVELGAAPGGGGLAQHAFGRPVRGYQTALAIDRYHRPVVALNSFDDLSVRVLRFEGDAWKKLGVAAAPKAYHPSLAIGADGAPVVFFTGDRREQKITETLFAARLGSGGWSDVALSGSATAGSASAATGPDGVPVVIWPVCGVFSAMGARLEKDRWLPFGGGESRCGGSTMAWGMTVDSRNRPVVAMVGTGVGGPNPVLVKRFDDGQWRQLGSLDGRSDDAVLARDGDGLWVTYTTGPVQVGSWDGAKWTMLPSPSGPGQRWSPAALAVSR